jgi:hypothetical protein
MFYKEITYKEGAFDKEEGVDNEKEEGEQIREEGYKEEGVIN